MGAGPTDREPKGQTVTEPLTDEQLTAMQRRLDRASVLRWTDSTALLAEVARQRAELEQARAVHFRDAAVILDRLADTAEARVAERYGTEMAAGSAAMVRECSEYLRTDAALLDAALGLTTTAPACTCRAETVHQAGCEGGQ